MLTGFPPLTHDTFVQLYKDGKLSITVDKKGALQYSLQAQRKLRPSLFLSLFCFLSIGFAGWAAFVDIHETYLIVIFSVIFGLYCGSRATKERCRELLNDAIKDKNIYQMAFMNTWLSISFDP